MYKEALYIYAQLDWTNLNSNISGCKHSLHLREACLSSLSVFSERARGHLRNVDDLSLASSTIFSNYATAYYIYYHITHTLRWKDTFSGEAIMLKLPLLPFWKESTLKGKNLLPHGANSF